MLRGAQIPVLKAAEGAHSGVPSAHTDSPDLKLFDGVSSITAYLAIDIKADSAYGQPG